MKGIVMPVRVSPGWILAIFVCAAVALLSCDSKDPVNPINRAPRVPSNPAPADGAEVGIDTVLTWNASDPDGDPLTFTVLFDTSEPPAEVSSGQSEFSWRPDTLLEYGQTYFWRVVARDNEGAATSGPQWTFTCVQNFPPSAPSGPSPADASADVSIDPTLSWQPSTDPESDPITYDLYLGETNPPPSFQTNVGATNYSPPTLKLDTQYYWQVRAHDPRGNTTPSPVWSFTTVAGQWRPLASGTAENLLGIWGTTGSDDIFVAGNNGTVRRSQDGTTFSGMITGTTSTLSEIWGTGSNDVFAAGQDTLIYHWNGTVWNDTRSSADYPSFVNGIWGDDPCNVYAVDLFNGRIMHFNCSVWTTRFEQVTVPFPSLLGIWGSPTGDLFAVGTQANGPGLFTDVVMRSSNGISWTRTEPGTGETLRHAWGMASNDVFVCGGYYGVPQQRPYTGIMLHFNGTSWTSMFLPVTDQPLFSVWGSASDDVFAVGLSGTVLHYDGTSWSTMSSGTAEELRDVWGTSASNVYSVGTNGTILRFGPP